jgi:hypothetical protein
MTSGRPVDRNGHEHAHFITAATLYRETDMPFSLDQAEKGA